MCSVLSLLYTQMYGKTWAVGKHVPRTCVVINTVKKRPVKTSVVLIHTVRQGSIRCSFHLYQRRAFTGDVSFFVQKG